jgi:hypothetical protein
VWKALEGALSTRSGTASVLAFAVDWFCFFGLRLFIAGLLRCWLLCWVQAWEGEIRYLVHRRRSSQDLFYQSQVIPRSQKALAGYSTENDKKNFMSADVRIFIFLRKWHGVAGWVAGWLLGLGAYPLFG